MCILASYWIPYCSNVDKTIENQKENSEKQFDERFAYE